MRPWSEFPTYASRGCCPSRRILALLTLTSDGDVNSCWALGVQFGCPQSASFGMHQGLSPDLLELRLLLRSCELVVHGVPGRGLFRVRRAMGVGRLPGTLTGCGPSVPRYWVSRQASGTCLHDANFAIDLKATHDNKLVSDLTTDSGGCHSLS